jgi:putative addiction module component (TIGR02574 family)
MLDFNSVLDGARQLSADDQLRLIDALWDMVPAEATLPLHEDWAAELERRVAAIRAGAAKTVPWTTIRDEALARIGHGKSY